MTTAALQMNRTIWAGAGRAAMLPLGILLLVVLMVVPIAPFLLDVFFILNIMIALAVLMVSLNTQKPLDFSSFPTVLLFATLLRLALNVASTRVVLVNGRWSPSLSSVAALPAGVIVRSLRDGGRGLRLRPGRCGAAREDHQRKDKTRMHPAESRAHRGGTQSIRRQEPSG